jgi:hypothetical protein
VLYHLCWTSYTMSLVVKRKPETCSLAVLLKILTGSADLVKVRQTLSRVGDNCDITNGLLLDVENFLYVVYAFPSIGGINEV